MSINQYNYNKVALQCLETQNIPYRVMNGSVAPGRFTDLLTRGERDHDAASSGCDVIWSCTRGKILRDHAILFGLIFMTNNVL